MLFLSGFQSALIFERDAADKRTELVGAALRGAASARVRVAESQELLRELNANAVGNECVTQPAHIKEGLRGYANLIRFNADGQVRCSTAPVPIDPGRALQPWFQPLAAGRSTSVAVEPQVGYAREPSLLANVRVEQADGQFGGVLTSVMTLTSLLPEKSYLFMPRGAEVALAQADGRLISAAAKTAFPWALRERLAQAASAGSVVWLAAARDGEPRLFTAAPVFGRDVYLVLSAPSGGLLTWIRLNPVSAFVLPILAFALALVAVWWVAEQGVVRWIAYLRRIAALYARGRYSVRPLRASAAPSEIRDLADTIGAMAATIGARDAALKESLAAKDDLMREIHHRVKNNLQVISSLLNFQQRALVDPAARAAIHDSRQRIVALGLIYRALYEGPDLKRVDFRAFVSELLAQLLVDGSGRAVPIHTQLNIDALTIDPDRLAPLALFIVEAIKSVCSHRFPKGDGRLAIAFGVVDNDAKLTISDNGDPLGSDESAKAMMAIFARQLGGPVVHTVSSGGGSVELTFPNRPARVAAAAALATQRA